MQVLPTLQEQRSFCRGGRHGSARSVLAVGSGELSSRRVTEWPSWVAGLPGGWQLLCLCSGVFLEISCWLSPKAGRERAAAGQHGDPALGGCREHPGVPSPAGSPWPFLLGIGAQVGREQKANWGLQQWSCSDTWRAASRLSMWRWRWRRLLGTLTLLLSGSERGGWCHRGWVGIRCEERRWEQGWGAEEPKKTNRTLEPHCKQELEDRRKWCRGNGKVRGERQQLYLKKSRERRPGGTKHWKPKHRGPPAWQALFPPSPLQ